MVQSNISNQALNSQFLTLINQKKNIVSLPSTSLFGTDGIRGRVGNQELLNSSLAFLIGFWAGKVLQVSNQQVAPVILGQDSRNSSNMLAIALSEGLTMAGVEVWNLGLCPTPAVAYLTSITEAMGGIMISASHNPPEDNGIKFFGANGTKLSTDLQNQIESGLRGSWSQGNMNTANTMVDAKYYHRPELISEYVAFVQQPLIKNATLAGMRVVLDLAWGAAVDTAPAIFKAMGAEVITLHDRPDGDRINVNCGSTHLEVLQQAVIAHQADLGFAFDGDADRVMAVDSHGKVVNGDYILYFWGQALRQQQKLPNDTIVSTVMANLGFENAWQKLGGKLLRTSVGDQYVHAAMVETASMLGGEQSGHILCPHYGVSGDGVLTALHIAALVKDSGVTLSQMLAESFQTYPQILKNIRVENRQQLQNWQDCEALQQAIALAETAMGDQGRILVRPSGTEPLIRIMVEAADADLANYWTNNLVNCAQKYLVG
ncbi:phosphoglucosamine mutase [Chondrocystis sp. NIES-4102]|nr:phosphoglucosamine mutase [Chondrocystis sp. NIES-4102]